MFITEYENVNIEISNYSIKKWEKKLNQIIDNNIIIVHWTFLKSTSFRTLFIKVKCDDCEIIFDRRIRDLDINSNIHYCKKCKYKGERGFWYGKEMSINSKEAFKKYYENNPNPFSLKEVKEKIKLSKPWLKTAKKNKGKKRSDETKKLMSKSALLAFKEGRRKPTNGWGNVKTKIYKNIEYQSTYELKFLQFVESFNLLHIIEKGDIIPYVDNEGKNHLYYVDFKIKNSNILFEIKSSYYWEKNLEINLIKKSIASINNEYYVIINNNFKLVEKMLKNYEKI